MSTIIFDPEAKHCALCDGRRVVNVIPENMGCNDSQEDECPHCLRRDLIQAGRTIEILQLANKGLAKRRRGS